MSGKQDLIEKIVKLKKLHNAVILAHNYQIPEVQDIADFSGDSLELSRKGKDIPAKMIVFCGVHFMAETSAMLSPDKVVLLPDKNAGCPMSDMATAEEVVAMRRKHPDALVVCYVNSAAAVKAVSDVCCTSANAVEIVSRIPSDKEIIFVPDRYLGAYAERMTGRKMLLWPGYCPTHVRFQPEHVEKARSNYPDAQIIVHPESRPEVCELADDVLSTGGMCRFAGETKSKTVIVGTELGLLHRLKKENPDKEFLPLLEQAVCPNMKLITLEKIAWALEEMRHRIEIPEEIGRDARAAIVQMLESGTIVKREVAID
ncbi:MAG: quinolinate synthase NadA [Proteobacteria bacterium]|nr:quinolinate synthase NadA [Pseudomonadota bacterium]